MQQPLHHQNSAEGKQHRSGYAVDQLETLLGQLVPDGGDQLGES